MNLSTAAAQLVTTKFNALVDESSPTSERPDPVTFERIVQTMAEALHDIPWVRAHNLSGMVLSPAQYRRNYNPTQTLPELRQFAFSQRPEAYDPSINDTTPDWLRKKKEAEWVEKRENYDTYLAADAAIKKYIRHIIDEIYYVSLKNNDTEYRNVTAVHLINYLRETYGSIANTDAIHIQTTLVNLLIENDNIPAYIANMNAVRNLAITAEMPIQDKIMHGSAYSAALQSEYYATAPVTDEWKKLAPTAQTWQRWQTMYVRAHVEKLQADRARENAGGANISTPLASAFNVTAQPRQRQLASPPPPSQNEAYLARVEESLDAVAFAASQDSDKLSELISRIDALQAKVDRTDKKAPSGIKFEPNGYCWTHGYKLREGHSSSTCQKRAEGHVETASRRDTKGGSTKNKGWDE